MNKTSKTAGAGKLAGLLGMARRAGKLTTGFDAVAGLISQEKAALVLTAADLSPKTEKELHFAVKDKVVPIVSMPLTKEEAGNACGFKKPVGILATEDKGFAAAMEKHCPHDLEEDSAL